MWKPQHHSMDASTYSKVKRQRASKSATKSEEMNKYWNQRHRLFSRYNDGIVMDKEGWFSVTPECIAEHVAQRCANAVVVDAFCGCGGNAIQFARHCSHVYAIDIDQERLDAARVNAQIYGVEDRITFLLGSYFDLIPTLKADVVFLSPPWGGVDYAAEAAFFDLERGMPFNGVSLYRHSLNIAPNVVFFLPKSTSREHIALLAGATPCDCGDIERCMRPLPPLTTTATPTTAPAIADSAATVAARAPAAAPASSAELESERGSAFGPLAAQHVLLHGHWPRAAAPTSASASAFTVASVHGPCETVESTFPSDNPHFNPSSAWGVGTALVPPFIYPWARRFLAAHWRAPVSVPAPNSSADQPSSSSDENEVGEEEWEWPSPTFYGEFARSVHAHFPGYCDAIGAQQAGAHQAGAQQQHQHGSQQEQQKKDHEQQEQQQKHAAAAAPANSPELPPLPPLPPLPNPFLLMLPWDPRSARGAHHRSFAGRAGAEAVAWHQAWVCMYHVLNAVRFAGVAPAARAQRLAAAAERKRRAKGDDGDDGEGDDHGNDHDDDDDDHGDDEEEDEDETAVDHGVANQGDTKRPPAPRGLKRPYTDDTNTDANTDSSSLSPRDCASADTHSAAPHADAAADVEIGAVADIAAVVAARAAAIVAAPTGSEEYDEPLPVTGALATAVPAAEMTLAAAGGLSAVVDESELKQAILDRPADRFPPLMTVNKHLEMLLRAQEDHEQPIPGKRGGRDKHVTAGAGAAAAAIPSTVVLSRRGVTWPELTAAVYTSSALSALLRRLFEDSLAVELGARLQQKEYGFTGHRARGWRRWVSTALAAGEREVATGAPAALARTAAVAPIAEAGGSESSSSSSGGGGSGGGYSITIAPPDRSATACGVHSHVPVPRGSLTATGLTAAEAEGAGESTGAAGAATAAGATAETGESVAAKAGWDADGWRYGCDIETACYNGSVKAVVAYFGVLARAVPLVSTRTEE